jgi:hypothetical protein
MVNTFLPYISFEECAKVLDYQRLGKQRVEAKTIINTIETKKGGWKDHVIVDMWKDHLPALRMYYNAIVNEWVKRGYNNNMELYPEEKYEVPWFVKNISIRYTHQASLIRKYPTFYKGIFNPPAKYLKYKYIWPKKLNKEQIDFLKAHPRTVVDIEMYAEPAD